MVCDAGGGTVVRMLSETCISLSLTTEKDLISYKVTGVDPLRMEECAMGDGKNALLVVIVKYLTSPRWTMWFSFRRCIF